MILDSGYQMTLRNLLKLSLISSFCKFFNFLKIILGSGLILWVTWNYKGLILFGLIGYLQFGTERSPKQRWREKSDLQLKHMNRLDFIFSKERC